MSSLHPLYRSCSWTLFGWEVQLSLNIKSVLPSRCLCVCVMSWKLETPSRKKALEYPRLNKNCRVTRVLGCRLCGSHRWARGTRLRCLILEQNWSSAWSRLLAWFNWCRCLRYLKLQAYRRRRPQLSKFTMIYYVLMTLSNTFCWSSRCGPPEG